MNMEAKKYTQFGTFMVVSTLSILIFVTIIFFKSGLLSGNDAIIPFSVVLIIMVCLFLFYNLSIYIDHTSLSFKMGIGLFGKSYELSEIKSCTLVRNSAFLGFGIKMLRNGWLYNVSGLRAIELEFYNKSSVVRIGTDRPEEISEIVNGLIEKRIPEGMGINPKKNTLNLRLIVGSLVVLFVVMLLFSGTQETKVKVENAGFTIKGIYGLTIPYKDIIQIDTVSSFPRISMRTNGFAFGKSLSGNFRFVDKSSAKLFVKAGNPPYILIKSKDRVPIYLNFKEKQKTRDLYKELKGKK
jgi:hypothetical protein